MKRKTIGLLVDYLEMPYSGMLVEGCINAAKKADVNLVIYPGTSINYNHTYSETDVIPERFSDQDVFQRTIVYEYAKKDAIDGLIIPIVTIGTCMSETEKGEFIQSFGVPVLLLEQQRDGVNSLVFDQNGIELELKHLIEECGCKKIAYISGPLKNNDAIYRIKEFKEVMAKYELEVPEHYIAYGDFTPFCQDVIEKMFAQCYQEIDAICVANDAMCTALYHVMEKYGVKPGVDILVTGYDNSDIALESEPRLTTIKADVKFMAEQALFNLLRVLDGEQVGAGNIPIELIRRASTGYEEDFSTEEIHEVTEGIHNVNSMKHVFINSIGTDMLGHANNLSMSMNSLAYDMKQAGFKECYLYLQEEAFTQDEGKDWNLPNRHTEQIFYDLDHDIDRIAKGQKRDLNELLSSILQDERRHTLVCYPVRLGEEHYGIFYLGYNISFNMDVYSVANQVATALHISSLVRQLASATEAKSNFLANMSHEIRTPINAVLGMDEMILRESKEEHIMEYASDIKTAGTTLLSLINDILDISKIESGKMELVNVDYHLSSLIYDVMNMVSLKADEKRLSLNLVMDESIPSGLFGDDVRIRQILVNLLNNAIKYTNEGGVTLLVERVEEKEDVIVLRFSVKDTGIGIQKEDIAKLFQRFQRIEEQRNRNVEGTGLGMSIAIRFLSLMDSKLNVESEYGEGSVFSFDLVQKIVNREPVGDLQNRVRNREIIGTYSSAFRAETARVLVVDDNKINRKLFKNLLKETKINIDVAASGQECLNLLKESAYDVVFMDHMMPDMDGIETYHKMLEIEHKSKNAKVIALTANAISGARELYLSVGFDDYLTKPIMPEKLEQLLLDMLPAEKVTKHDDIPEEVSESDAINEFFLTLGTIPELRLDYARLYAPDDTFLRDCVVEFYNVMDSELEELQRLYHAYIESLAMGDKSVQETALKAYGVKIHAMKSSSAIVGAISVSGMAFSLEQASYEWDHDTIVNLMPVFIKHWKSLKKKIAICENMNSSFEKEIEAVDIEITKPRENEASNVNIPAEDSIKKENSQNVMDNYNSDVRSRILVVDDNILNLKKARHILQDYYDGYYVSSGKDCLAVLQSRRVDLILLDLHMPDMDGFEVIKQIKSDEKTAQIPVIFLTADNNQDAELRGFESGALDFIIKPFVAEIMLQRVNRILELEYLRRHLASEVAIQTRVSEEKHMQLERLSMQSMQTLVAAIDAKDRYTNGHSMRVARYSKMLAERMGKSEKDQLNVYYVALLHDVGKIGIPDEIINKPASLSDEEYAVIKSHSQIGARILDNISELPDISIGAHWHHERFDGRGYPDGLSGYDIPEVARIIGVADAYDAMTSNRSYRQVLDQEVVRGEILRGMGTQFDPDIASIMIDIIDEDVTYELKEQPREEDR